MLQPLLESPYPISVLFFILLLTHLDKEVVIDVVVTVLTLVLLILLKDLVA